MPRTRTVPHPHPQSAREVLAINLRRMRAERDWTQEDLAHYSGLDRSFIAHVERQSRNISLDNLEKLAIALSVPISKLLDT
ncbi:helix-turn-helix domain-containing protein [Burkholderia ubonensis]|uniref:helix-turn-helix domain-containing protein n=1 Tax=Burkholderia ubonensis TaxID=101571 RepID=UPI000F563360|nr:helix-turn-helix transcriptional regulator [Burkholderia ubonensis]RQP27708.1 XRE family transcriptional regulator [Burkholderia ubonensis]RQP29724.1 XRE family transcriptional regulator [Burkholderia ubonensis]RQP31880.1 XRE family transcriptional regulator [Burkholderia ubonensis]RQP47823.1 XRE family transcriptional regulator [Burkholderia ubonensis]RQP50840.1 XRE family transcriptional regulator [Burkholderia ubonensis]